MKYLAFSLLFLTGCATVPKETLILSGEMGSMIQDAKIAHVNLLNEYELSRRERIDEYMSTTWIPRFITKMAEGGDLWGKVCKTSNECTKVSELQGFVLAAASKITAKRKELTDALDYAMTELRTAVAQHYDILQLSNKTVTDNLRSVRANDEVLESTMKMAGMKPEALTPLKDVSRKLDQLFD